MSTTSTSSARPRASAGARAGGVIAGLAAAAIATPARAEPAGPASPDAAPAAAAPSGGGLPATPVLPPPRAEAPAEASSARFDEPRVGAVGGEETATAADGSVAARSAFGLVRVVAPTRLVGDDGYGVAWGAAASGGQVGSAAVGDVHAGAGPGLWVGPVQVDFLLVGGADRVGGGFAPIAGVYGGVAAAARAVIRPRVAVEAESAWLWSTGVDERRVEASALFAAGPRVVAIGVAYDAWRDRGASWGVTLALGW